VELNSDGIVLSTRSSYTCKWCGSTIQSHGQDVSRAASKDKIMLESVCQGSNKIQLFFLLTCSWYVAGRACLFTFWSIKWSRTFADLFSGSLLMLAQIYLRSDRTRRNCPHTWSTAPFPPCTHQHSCIQSDTGRTAIPPGPAHTTETGCRTDRCALSRWDRQGGSDAWHKPGRYNSGSRLLRGSRSYMTRRTFLQNTEDLQCSYKWVSALTGLS